LDWAESYTVGDKDYLLINYMRKVVYYLELHEVNKGLVKSFNTPLGTIVKYSGRRHDNEFFFHFTSFLTPGQIFHFDLTKLDSEPRLLRQAQPKNFNPDDYKIEQVFYKSKDGTEVPMFIVYRKDLERDGQNPCILYGYGGFNIQITSTFNINRIAWLKNFKGILAVANIRGGGELGQDWHDSGRLLNKQNCFNDFIAAGEYLIENNYTKRDRLAIEGGSNGGLLVAATSNQRPDLFGASICHVGVLDMIRFTSFTIGHAWTSDYGDPKERDHFENLIKYSPYHNIPEPVERYPATLLLTADHDDRVVPAHSLKFIAQLQHKLGDKLPNTPLLIRVDTKAGHGAGRPTSKVIDEYTDIYSFLYNVLNLEKYYNET
jgi:prolyl oligopeptidase